MSFARTATRVAVGGVSAALATAGLVGVTSTSASAVTAATTYSCNIPGLGAKDLPVSVNIPLIPPTGPAGGPVAATLLTFSSTLTVPNDVATALGGLGINGARSDDFSAAFGTTSAPAPVVWDTPTPPANPATDPTVFSGKGVNKAFVLPAAGTYAISMPKSFTLTPTKSGAAFPATAPCTSAAPTQIASITLAKQNSLTKAKAPKKAKKGATVTVKVTVSNDHSKDGGVLANGKLTVKDGKKKVGKGKVKNGKATIKVKGLAVGSHSLVVTYAGDSFENGSASKPLSVNVTK